MRLLVFKHIACEHPGVLRSFLAEDGIPWDAVELAAGEPIPALESYDMLWVMGGPMDVWDVEEHPWLPAEKRAIRHWVGKLRRPYLGVCLGHQLLADALGGTCGPQRPPEVGICDVSLTEAAGSAIRFSAGCRPGRRRCSGMGSRSPRRRKMPSSSPGPTSVPTRRCGSGHGLFDAISCRARGRHHSDLGPRSGIRGRACQGARARRTCRARPRGRAADGPVRRRCAQTLSRLHGCREKLRCVEVQARREPATVILEQELEKNSTEALGAAKLLFDRHSGASRNPVILQHPLRCQLDPGFRRGDE